jgi:hypothetical protein
MQKLNTAGGGETFYKLFDEYLDVLLHPDYTEEEVRREVRNWGVSENPADETLRLEEKGTVYNEMSSSMNQPGRRLSDVAKRMIYGEQTRKKLASDAGRNEYKKRAGIEGTISQGVRRGSMRRSRYMRRSSFSAQKTVSPI